VPAEQFRTTGPHPTICGRASRKTSSPGPGDGNVRIYSPATERRAIIGFRCVIAATIQVNPHGEEHGL
jgi:hypothetical protein